MGIPEVLKIIRGHIVVGGVLAFSLGALLAITGGGSFDPTRVALCYTVVLLGDLSAHFSNDYFDVDVDRCVERKKFFAGSAVLVTHSELRSLARVLSLLLLALSNMLAAAIVILYGAPLELLAITLGANFLGWSYSAPPFRLISRGLGELAVAAVTGFAIPAVGYLAVRGQFDLLFACLTVPFMLYGLTLSLSLEAPDREIDLKGGKRNLVVRKGERAVFSMIAAAVSAASLLFLVYVWLLASPILDLRVVVLFSLAPLAAGFFGFTRVYQKKDVYRFSTLNIASLFLFNILMVAYLLALVLGTKGI
ncbi:MAG: prenyltransferase [Candidatus Bathyarchaeota archaeon]|nr:prenyltransferase [Candidatus Bathyarchaeota archaeon]